MYRCQSLHCLPFNFVTLSSQTAKIISLFDLWIRCNKFVWDVCLFVMWQEGVSINKIYVREYTISIKIFVIMLFSISSVMIYVDELSWWPVIPTGITIPISGFRLSHIIKNTIPVNVLQTFMLWVIIIITEYCSRAGLWPVL